MNRPKCDGGTPSIRCGVWPTWKVRAKGDKAERNWLYACGRHINQVAKDWAPEAGCQIDLIRVLSDD